MPIKHAAFKALRKAKKSTSRNAHIIGALKKLEKKVRSTGDITMAALAQAFDKAVHAGALHANKARRKKSRLMKLMHAKKVA